MSGFDAFVAIDWSGAKGRYDGIAVAVCGPGGAAPRLVQPADRWTRTAVAAWLSAEIASGRRLLAGLDFAFAWPYRNGYPGVPDAGSVLDLWNAIEAASGAEGDFCAGAVVERGRFAKFFRTSGSPSPSEQRQTEAACARLTKTTPESVFKLIGPKQVGKASLTGMRVLRHLTTADRDAVSVWPFEPSARSVLVEIFPTLFRKQATGGVKKLDAKGLDAALPVFGSKPLGIVETLSDHATDALLSAAALRHLAGHDPDFLSGPVDELMRREGWIVGVPLPVAAL